MNNYTVLHLHTELSNATTTIDSVTKYQDYIDRAKELGMKALAITEHGSVFRWYFKKLAIENAGMKYIHGAEVYVTETLDIRVRDNYHCVLLAKNYDGVKEINELISKSFNRDDNSFYFNPRITYSDLKNTSDNVIVSTACLGGILNWADTYMVKDFINWLAENKHRCYLEIQHHLVDEQIEYNKRLIELSKEYGIPLLATTDTHALNNTHLKGRSILQQSKKIHFDNEDGWDLTFKTYDELCRCFKLQGISEEIYLEAIENTNRIADSVEEFELERDFKYPKLYDNPQEVFKEKINRGYLTNKYIRDRYSFEEVKKVLHEEYDTYDKVGAINFMLLQTYLREWEHENGIQCGYARGSCSGSMIAYLLGITEMDSMKFKLNYFRFMNPARVSLADIDTDYSEKDRAMVKKFLLADHLGLDNIQCCEIITFNTIATKGAVKDVARALDISVQEAQEISNQIIDDEIPSELRSKYKELFEYVDIINGTVVSIGSHPSGVLVTDRNIATDIGVCTLSSSEYPVSMLNMKELDDLMYVKLDILGLDGIGVINDTCKLVGIDRLTPDNVDLDDENVWKSIRDDATLIFQWESSSAQAFLRKFMSDATIAKVKTIVPNFSYIKWFSFGNGLIRPACASYRDDVANGVFCNNGLKELDEFLAPTLGHVTMQEDIMKFLVKFCGYSDAESDNVRRAIAKKKGTEQLLPEIKERFIEYTNAHYNISKEESSKVIEPFLQVLLDASSYAFSWNHSDSYSCLGYIEGYLRYYYPLEFVTSAFNVFSGKAEKIQTITEYAQKHDIRIKSPKFEYVDDRYICDKSTNTIYQGLSSIKGVQSITAEVLKSVRDLEPKTFLEVLYLLDEIKIDGKKVNKKNIEILIEIGFFDRFGSVMDCKSVLHWFDKLSKKKTLKKDSEEEWLLTMASHYAEKETEKQLSKLDMKSLLKEIESKLPKREECYFDLIKSQIKYLGYADCESSNISPNIYMVRDSHKDKFGRCWISLTQLCSGFTKEYEIDKTFSKSHRACDEDLVRVIFGSKDVYTKSGDGWIKTGDKRVIVKAYSIIKEI